MQLSFHYIIFCSVDATVQVIKLRRMRWARHVARMGEEEGGGVYGLAGETGGKETVHMHATFFSLHYIL